MLSWEPSPQADTAGAGTRIDTDTHTRDTHAQNKRTYMHTRWHTAQAPAHPPHTQEHCPKPRAPAQAPAHTRRTPVPASNSQS